MVHRSGEKSFQARTYTWSARRISADAKRFDVSFMNPKGWGQHWIADLATGRVEKKEKELSRLAPDSPVVAQVTPSVHFQKGGWLAGKGLATKIEAELNNVATTPWVRARCWATLMVTFENGQEQKRGPSRWGKHKFSPRPSKSKPWLPKQTATCISTTTALELVYKEFPVRSAKVWVEVELLDAFGKVFSGAVGEVKLSAVELAKGWAPPPKVAKRKRKPGRHRKTVEPAAEVEEVFDNKVGGKSADDDSTDTE